MTRPGPCLVGFAALLVTAGSVPQAAAEGTLAFSAAEYGASESVRSATITVTRADSRVGAVSVDYATSDGTATAGSDYGEATGTLSWDDGDTAEKAFSVAMMNDDLSEGDETVKLVLTNAQGAEIGPLGSAVLTITDDDPCLDGDTQPCYPGAPETEGVGACQAGTSTCASGAWGDCLGFVLPEKEDCHDSQDNDCDGFTDDLDTEDCEKPDGGSDAGVDAGADASSDGTDTIREPDTGGGCSSSAAVARPWWGMLAPLAWFGAGLFRTTRSR